MTTTAATPKRASQAGKTPIRALRISDEHYAEIKRRAKARKLSITSYVVQCALGELDADAATTDQRIDRLERRIAAVERLAELGAFS